MDWLPPSLPSLASSRLPQARPDEAGLLTWTAIMSCRLGHDTKHFNVGQYRRVQKTASDIQNASFFDPNNEVGPTCTVSMGTSTSLTYLPCINLLRSPTRQTMLIISAQQNAPISLWEHHDDLTPVNCSKA